MLRLGDQTFNNRLIIGTARYPSPECLLECIQESHSEIVTVSLRREDPKANGSHRFWDYLKEAQVKILPNTAGCLSVKEAVTTAHLARDLFETDWIKLEVIGDNYSLQPDPFGTVEAAKILIKDGFEVFPYTIDDLVVAEKLVDVGCNILMPWGSPIGSGRGLQNPHALKSLRKKFPQTTLIVDAGIGIPSHAAQAMELGYDAVLLNTAIAQSMKPPVMAKAFHNAVMAGRWAYEAVGMPVQEEAVPSTPWVGTPFWHHQSGELS